MEAADEMSRSRDQEATEFEWISITDTEHAQSETGKFQFLKEGYLFMTEEETDHIHHGIYASTSSKSPNGGTVVGGAQAVLVRRTSDPTIKVKLTLKEQTRWLQ